MARLQQTLRGCRDVRLALLFGSFARGEAREGSDVDIAVLGPIRDPLGLRAELVEACGREVDLVSLEDPGFALLQAIVRDGKPLHEATRGAYAS